MLRNTIAHACTVNACMYTYLFYCRPDVVEQPIHTPYIPATFRHINVTTEKYRVKVREVRNPPQIDCSFFTIPVRSIIFYEEFKQIKEVVLCYAFQFQDSA